MEKCPRFYIESYGCSANLSDSEIIAGILSKACIKQAENPESAGIIIINTCYVKQSTESKILRRISNLREKFPEKKLIITGCMTDAIPEKILLAAPKAFLVSTNRIDEIGVIATSAKGHKEILGNFKLEKLGLPKLRKNCLVDIIQICSGCLGRCTYCGTKIAKGSLFSYPPEKIKGEIKEISGLGCREFWLTGQDIGCYGFDIGTTLPELLEKILENQGKYFVRLGMMNPNHLEKIVEPLLNVCEDVRVMKFFHIPIQSGSDRVLSDMSRGYLARDFEKPVSRIRQNFPFCTIGTDIIVGYPTETEEDFEKTMELIRKTKPDWINVSKFTSRQGTSARKLKPLNSAWVKDRSERASILAKEIQIEQTKKWLGWSGEVLVTQKGIGKNFAHREISIRGGKVGEFVKVRVERVEKFRIIGELLR
jgi:threonylcarbamoyladenosine tRNA methylthiotransferase CDKAL1